MAHSQRRQGRFDDAEATLREALGIDADSAVARNGLGVVYKETGRFAEAAEQYAAALAGSGGNAGLRADVLHNLAGLECARGRFAEAVAPAREALALRERMHGAAAIEVAADVAVLGAVLAGLDPDDGGSDSGDGGPDSGDGRADSGGGGSDSADGGLGEGEALLWRAHGLWSRRFGPDHYEVAVCLHNLGMVQVRRGDLAAAGETLREALRIKRRALGPAHVELAALQDNLRAVGERCGAQAAQIRCEFDSP